MYVCALLFEHDSRLKNHQTWHDNLSAKVRNKVCGIPYIHAHRARLHVKHMWAKWPQTHSPHIMSAIVSCSRWCVCEMEETFVLLFGTLAHSRLTDTTLEETYDLLSTKPMSDILHTMQWCIQEFRKGTILPLLSSLPCTPFPLLLSLPFSCCPSLPSPLEEVGLLNPDRMPGSTVSSPSRVWGADPNRNTTWSNLALKSDSWWHQTDWPNVVQS